MICPKCVNDEYDSMEQEMEIVEVAERFSDKSSMIYECPICGFREGDE